MSESASSGDDFDDEELKGKPLEEESSDSEDENDDVCELDVKRVAELQEKLCENPYDYDSNLELIKCYRNAGDLDKVREARETMSARFPLTPELWLEWINDEIQLATSREDKNYVMKLFERATNDYVSPDVWLEYVQFSIGFIDSGEGIQMIRETFEKAVTAVGLHVQKGCLLWEAYREFETSLVGIIKDDELHEQYRRIYTLFKRQFSIPLMFMEDKYSEFEEWIGEVQDSGLELDVESVKYGFKKAVEQLQKLKPYEDALTGKEKPSLDDYNRYIEYEEANGTPPRVQCVYERAILDHCLEPQLWLNYTKYVDEKLKNLEISQALYERATRNCSWVVSLWINYLKSIERFGREKKDVMVIFERGLACGFHTGDDYRQLWTAYLDFLRRKTNFNDEKEVESLRKSFLAATEHLANYEDADPYWTIQQYLAKVEAKFCKNVEMFRKIWNEILLTQRLLSSQAQIWIEYANQERVFGDEAHYRKALLRGLHQCNDWPETIGEILVKHLREEADSIVEVDDAIKKYEKAMRHINKKREAIADKEARQQEQKKEENRPLRQKRKLPDRNTDLGTFKVPAPPSSEGPSEAKKSKKSDAAKPKPTGNAERTEPKPVPNYVKPKAEDEGLRSLHTIFVSNLDYKTDENEIRDKFSQFGEIKEIRLVRNYRGLSKGYCYIEYTNVESCREALKHDRMLVDGRPCFVTEFGKKPDFKFLQGPEKNKLFVTNLNTSVSKEELSKIFSEFGELRDVRLVTYRNGHPKGSAYVEYADELGAKNGLKADGRLVKDKNIKVAISNPPPKSKEIDTEKILGRANFTSHSSGHARPKISVPLIPTSVRRSVAQKSNGTTEASSKPLSNDDFRSLLK